MKRDSRMKYQTGHADYSIIGWIVLAGGIVLTSSGLFLLWLFYKMALA